VGQMVASICAAVVSLITHTSTRCLQSEQTPLLLKGGEGGLPFPPGNTLPLHGNKPDSLGSKRLPPPAPPASTAGQRPGRGGAGWADKELLPWSSPRPRPWPRTPTQRPPHRRPTGLTGIIKGELGLPTVLLNLNLDYFVCVCVVICVNVVNVE
jgi:hypothetical protein